MSNKSIYVLNGPNLNLLGKREPAIYGAADLVEIETDLRETAKRQGHELVFRQSNHEGELVDWLHEAGDKARGVILNAGAYTHTSIALHDAIRTIEIPCIEVHLSNIFQRESFRHHSFLSPVCQGMISGFGAAGYRLALLALTDGTA